MTSDRLHARSAAGKQTLTSNTHDAAVAPGKATLTEHLPTTTAGMCAFVKPHAGATVRDGGGYTFRVLDDGNFEITGSPKGKENSVGHVISPSTNAYAWNLIATKLLSEVPPKPAPIPVAQPPAPPPPPPAPAPGLIDRAVSTVEAGLQEIKAGANALWDRWMGDDAEPAAVDPQVAPSNSNVAPAPAPSKPPPAKVPAPTGTGPRADTLDLAMSRAARGTGGTEYTLNGLPHEKAIRLEEIKALLIKHGKAVANKKGKDPSVLAEGELSQEEFAKITAEKAELDAEAKVTSRALADSIASGDEDVTRFYCSGLSMWTLAAAGYNITAKLKGPDGTEYRGQIMKEVDVDANGKQVKKGKGVGKARVVAETKYVTLKLLVDGDPLAIEIVTRAKAAGTSTVEITGTGYQTEHDGAGLADAATGAAGAFIAAGIGDKSTSSRRSPATSRSRDAPPAVERRIPSSSTAARATRGKWSRSRRPDGRCSANRARRNRRRAWSAGTPMTSSSSRRPTRASSASMS
jgi:hypothetical protein